jgi:hypothetical protein
LPRSTRRTPGTCVLPSLFLACSVAYFMPTLRMHALTLFHVPPAECVCAAFNRHPCTWRRLDGQCVCRARVSLPSLHPPLRSLEFHFIVWVQGMRSHTVLVCACV